MTRHTWVVVTFSCLVACAWLAGPAPVALAQDCTAHPADELAAREVYSSPTLHKKREGVLLPMMNLTPARPLLESYTIQADTSFFACHVRNLAVDVRAEFVLSLWTALTPASLTSERAAYRFQVAFPLTTHALYGDHNRFNEIGVTVDGRETGYRVAMDYNVFSIREDEYGYQQLYYKGRLINNNVHPLLTEAADLNDVAPNLVDDGFDLIIYFGVAPRTARGISRVVVNYTTSSNDFAGCCDEVRDPAVSGAPYMFYFDLSNTGYWAGTRAGTVVLNNAADGVFSSVPDLPYELTYTNNTAIMQMSGKIAEDLAVPLQPAVLTVSPREWPVDGEGRVLFELRWAGDESGFFDNALIERIKGTDNVAIDANLPIVLSAEHPVDYFWVRYAPDVLSDVRRFCPLDYIEVMGIGRNGTYPAQLFEVSTIVPIDGLPITGHDLELDRVSVGPSPSHVPSTIVTAVVSNNSCFKEPLTATVLVDGRYIEAFAFEALRPHEVREIRMPIDWIWELPAWVEVEIEPSAGETDRMDNAMKILVGGLSEEEIHP